MTSVRHTGIVVSDLDAALRFWCHGLGFTEDRRSEESGPVIDGVLGLDAVDVTTVKLVAPGGGMVELLRFRSHPDVAEWQGTPCSTGLTHIALTVADIDQVCRRLADLGAEVRPVVASPDGRVRLTYCRGPEGLLVELVEEVG